MRTPPLRLIATGLLLAASPLPSLLAADLTTDPAAAPAVPPAPPAPPAPAGPWTRGLKLGLYATSVYASNQEASRDSTINSAAESFSVRAKGEGFVNWTRGKDTVENKLVLEYGQEKQDNPSGSTEWVENIDNIRYDGIYRRSFAKPHFIYLSWGDETSFTGPAPEEAILDPGRAWISAGYGQLYENMFPQKNRLEWRLGVRGQQYYSFGAYDVENRFQVGPEAFLRYERTVNEHLYFFGQYEGWSEFSDLGHVTNLITAGLTAKLAAGLTADLSLRAYYEGRPNGAEGEPGYDQWSMRQDTLLGMSMEF